MLSEVVLSGFFDLFFLNLVETIVILEVLKRFLLRDERVDPDVL